MSEPLLLLEDLTKVFRRRFGGGAASELRAVDGVSLRVHRGDVFGFLGPNGAGKSTTIRMALGLIHPTAGRVEIAGHDLSRERLRALKKVGAFVETPSFYPFLSGRRNLEIFAGLSGRVEDAEIDGAVERVGLLGREHDLVKVYSHGMKARLGIAACLLPRPELLILDEPTDGLDPHGLREIRDLIRRLAREEGLTVFLSSHLLGEVENLCNRVAILEKGRMILEGELEALERAHRRWRIETDRPAQAAAMLSDRLGLSPDLTEPTGLRVALGGRAPEEVCAALVTGGFAVRRLAPEEGWLDRLFLERTTSRESIAGNSTD